MLPVSNASSLAAGSADVASASASRAADFDTGWQKTRSSTKTGKSGQDNFIWMRTELFGPPLPQPTLYFLIVEQIFEAYLDGELIYRFGQLDGEGPRARRFLGNRTHMISLPSDYVGKQLVLRIHSSDSLIGISGRVRLGSGPAIISTMLREDTSAAIVGIILCAIGIVAIGLYLPQRSDADYLYYGGFAFSMGLWLVCQMGCRNYLYDSPMGWLTIEIYALYIAVASLMRFVYQIFGSGPLGLARVLSYLLGGFVVISAALVGLGIVPLVAPLHPFRILLLICIAYTVFMMARLSWQGHIEARLFAAGFFCSALFAVHDTLALFGLLPRSEISFSQFGQGGFVLCLGLILTRRFQKVHRTVALAKKSLSEKVIQLEERNREVVQLNDDLRRQIEARSKDMAASILDASSSFSHLAVQILDNGFVIAERYRVVRLIGQGGMGVVYEVERVTDKRHLAAKVLSVQAGKQALARFAREAQLLAKLRHPNLVAIQDIDMTQSQMAYIVMDLVEGQSLTAHAERYGQVEFALCVLTQVASALASVHSQGIVHRDLKPDNVLILHAEDTSRLTVKLVDFGVSMILDNDKDSASSEDSPAKPSTTSFSPENASAKSSASSFAPSALFASPHSAQAVTISAADVDSIQGTGPTISSIPPVFVQSELSKTARERLIDRPVTLTQTGVIMGTPLYMAPELRKGAKFARPVTDIFSFGVMAFEILTGQLPSEVPALFLIMKSDRPWYPRLQNLNAAIPAVVAALVEGCLDQNPQNRPTAATIYTTLQRQLQQTGAAS